VVHITQAAGVFNVQFGDQTEEHKASAMEPMTGTTTEIIIQFTEMFRRSYYA